MDGARKDALAKRPQIFLGKPMTKATPAIAALVAAALVSPAQADEREELLKLKNTTVNLIDALVQQGILDKKKAQAIIQSAEAKAATEAKQQRADEQAKAAQAQAQSQSTGKAEAGAVVAGAAAGATVAGVAAAADGKAKPQSVRVALVPEFVKQEIREQVRAELKDDVVKEVKAQAKSEKWGIPAALPDWVSRIHPYVDGRIRFQWDIYQADNAPAFDWLQINRDGGLSQALAQNQAYLNTHIDRVRFRERFRVGFDADVTDGLKLGFRLATSNQFSPVSVNQTLGDTNQGWLVVIDRAFLQYDFKDSSGTDWFTVWGGRTPNPFVSTDMMFSPDLNFEGVAGNFRWNFGGDNPALQSYRTPNHLGRYGINLGEQQHPNTVFATLGAFPLQEVNFSAADKYLFAAQLGADWLVHNESRLKVAAGYFHYTNVTAQRNALNSNLYDWTAPQFIQKGNSLVAINDAQNQTLCNVGALGAQNICLVGLASGFKVFNATAMFDFADLAPTHIMLTGDFAKNFGFNENYIKREFGDTITPKTLAWQVRLDVGRTDMRRLNDWGLFFAYRYLERDAILDAFTDNVFHQGGTDAKGWMIGAQYGLATNTWLNLRWFNTDAIEGPPLSIDTLNVDLNARF